MTSPEPLPYKEFVVSQNAQALCGRVVRFYDVEGLCLEHTSYLAHTFYLENDEPASTIIPKHTRFLREHFTPAYDGILDKDVTEGIEFVVTARGPFYGHKFCMRTCASPRNTYRVWAREECTDWRWRQFYMTRDMVAPFHAPFVTGDVVPPPTATVVRGGVATLVVMKNYHRITGTCTYFYSHRLAALIKGGVMHAAARGDNNAVRALQAVVSPDQLVTETVKWYNALRAYEPHTAQWGSIGRLYGLKGRQADFNGNIVAVNRLWAENGDVRAECMFLDNDVLGPVDVPEGHVASAEFIQTPAKLQIHLEMPSSVHTLVGLVAKTAFHYVDDRGNVESRVCIEEQSDGTVVCDKCSLHSALVHIGKQDKEWWQCKLLECLHAMKHSDGAFGDDPNRVMLSVRALRGLAEHCYQERTGKAAARAAAERGAEDDWCDEIRDALTTSAKTKFRKRKQAKKNAKRRGNRRANKRGSHTRETNT
jgi:hypothetical protein